ncbi:hypothetical protein KMZ29_18415 [Bradyrhizobium sediminis]|uniref:DUF4760 domain-containing protein n=1 Tax=Bradyrhizobium sediminis TaxID=2840469 RepID=A0A975NAV5_9BRAD|nr:hypothetical protein [Bradyrhizobium sediminis]QWG11692.1 hypothetical protein KMZ29_18415 [Bradyrhizobium sediminis]
MTMLVNAYYWSQIALAIIAAVAAIAAYVQIQTFKRFELMKMLETPHVKAARQALFLASRKHPGEKWWNTDDPAFDKELEQAAATIAGSFDIVGIVAKGANRRFFRSHWGHSIRWTHKALEGFLMDRRTQAGGNPGAFSGFEGLYAEATRLRPN